MSLSKPYPREPANSTTQENIKNIKTVKAKGFVNFDPFEHKTSDPSLWIGDTGASLHLTGDLSLLTNTRDGIEDDIVEVANGQDINIFKLVTFLGTYHNPELQQTVIISLEDVGFIPGMKTNLVSLTTAMDKGQEMHGKGKRLTMTDQDGFVYLYDKILQGRHGRVNAISFLPLPKQDLACLSSPKDPPSASTQTKLLIDINHLHQLLGHPCMKHVLQTANHNNITVTGDSKPCASCELAKSHKQSNNKKDLNRSTIIGERIQVDLSYVNRLRLGLNKYWLLDVDQASGHKLCRFIPTRDQMPNKVVEIIVEMRAFNLPVKFIRADNAGENQLINQALVQNNIAGVRSEWIPPRNPQQNGMVERGFETLYNLICAMYNGAKIKEDDPIKDKTWAECANTSVFLHNLTIKSQNFQTSSYSQLFQKITTSSN